MRLDGPGDTAVRVFGAAELGIIEGFGVVVEVFFGPGRFELPFAGPLDAVPAVSVIGRGFGHEEVFSVPGARPCVSGPDQGQKQGQSPASRFDR